ncbi:MAG TPA: class I SAM-dependent methyltransferase [Nitrososphaeraceae archaeon]|nr:class I SAM-dependent methyltransferase [Nitrososphaeraceae archaeon]
MQKKYKETERQSWDSVATGWQKWWQTVENSTQNVSDRLIELAEIKPGSRVLDIATGIGEPAITAAKQIGNNGHILATDISPQMLSVAKQRAISLGLENVIEFKEGDTETFDLPSSTFDAVLCRWGMTLFLDFDTGLPNIYRSLVDGGRFAAAVWSSADKVPVLAIAANTVMKVTNSSPPSPKVPGLSSLSDENVLKNSFAKSGFRDVSVERVSVTFEFDSAETYTSCILETSASLHVRLTNETQVRRKEILKAVTEAAGRYRDNNTGKVRLENETILIVGKK